MLFSFRVADEGAQHRRKPASLSRQDCGEIQGGISCASRQDQGHTIVGPCCPVRLRADGRLLEHHPRREAGATHPGRTPQRPDSSGEAEIPRRSMVHPPGVPVHLRLHALPPGLLRVHEPHRVQLRLRRHPEVHRARQLLRGIPGHAVHDRPRQHLRLRDLLFRDRDGRVACDRVAAVPEAAVQLLLPERNLRSHRRPAVARGARVPLDPPAQLRIAELLPR